MGKGGREQGRTGGKQGESKEEGRKDGRRGIKVRKEHMEGRKGKYSGFGSFKSSAKSFGWTRYSIDLTPGGREEDKGRRQEGQKDRRKVRRQDRRKER